MNSTLYRLFALLWLVAAVPAVAEQTLDTPTLERRELVRAVLERNPSIEAARQAWRAAAEREEQVTALADPRLSTSIAPLSIGGDRFGASIEASQMLPFPGKRRLRGAIARAEADAARNDFEAVQLELATMASLLFDEHYRVARALAINKEHQELLAILKESAEAQYVVGRASLQDPLQAEVELAHLMHRDIVLGTERDAVRAQINELLHRPPEAPVPPPPVSLSEPDIPGSSAELQEIALTSRPVLDGAEARIRARESATDLARLDFYPDFHVMGSYNSMWMSTDHQWMAGIGIELPVQREKRRAAVREAEARLAAARSEKKSFEDQIRSQVDQAYRAAVEAQHVVALHRDRLVPAARDQVQAARAGFETGRNSFLAVIEAERNLRTVELQLVDVTAALHQRLARLDRATGRMPVNIDNGGMQ
ncbi:MAG TPA: TolC family protein [Thermoanaerobaculia bacterium]|nr:TolC family protein [Thermoanaerobaculia bacterium]